MSIGHEIMPRLVGVFLVWGLMTAWVLLVR